MVWQGKRKIDDDTALEIFKMALTGKYTYIAIGRKLGLTNQYIADILRRDYGLRFVDWVKIRNKYIVERWENYKGTYEEFCCGVKEKYGLSGKWTVDKIITQNGSSIVPYHRESVKKQIRQHVFILLEKLQKELMQLIHM